MRLTELLFSFKGRINRKPWWLATIAFGVAASVITGLIEVAARSAGQTAIVGTAPAGSLCGNC